jgi:predicted  nucleic acid-binding Zn-ribbon protein
MKNKKIYIALIVILMAGTTSFVFAQNPTDSTTRAQVQNIKADATTKINEVRTEAKNQIQNKLVDAVNQKIENRYSRITNRFQATIDRLDNIISRIETRIAKIKADGGDTTTAVKAVADAKKYMDQAKAEMVTLQSTADSADNANASTNTDKVKEIKAVLSDLQKSSNTTQKLLKQAHTSLTNSIGILKGLKVGQSTNNTPNTNQSN